MLLYRKDFLSNFQLFTYKWYKETILFILSPLKKEKKKILEAKSKNKK